MKVLVVYCLWFVDSTKYILVVFLSRVSALFFCMGDKNKEFIHVCGAFIYLKVPHLILLVKSAIYS